MAVRHRDGGDPDRSVVENHDRDPGDALRPGRDVNVDAPDQRAGVRHVGVQRHDVQVVGVSGQDALDQIGRARGRSFGINGRLTVEERIAFRQRFRARRPVDPDRRERPVRVLADAPRVEDQAGQIADVVGMKVSEEHRFQTGEVQARGGEGGRRTATAVDDEDSFVDDQRR